MTKYIDTTLVEGNMLNDLAALLMSAGWTHEKYFKKTVFPNMFINPMASLQPQTSMFLGVAEHLILRHPDPDVKVLYGFALFGYFTIPYGMLPIELQPMKNVSPPIRENMASVYRPRDGYKDLSEWATNKYPKVRQNHTLYLYMCDMVSDDLPENGDICIAAEGNYIEDMRRAALDIEVHDTAYYMLGGSPMFKIEKAMPDYKQSPIQQMSLRIPPTDTTDTSLSYLTPFEQTNWHDDSLIRVRGITNGAGKENYFFLMLQADAAASYENNGAPLTPLFLGKLEAYDPEDKWCFALSAGSAFPTMAPEFDFDDPKYTRSRIQPLLKNYVMSPANGIDNIMIYRTKYGSYYQEHVLHVSSPSNIMPPILTHDKRDYPRAWNRPESHVQSYQYNPGRYTGAQKEVASSYAEVTHMDEGVRGKFPDTIVTLPLNLITGDRLKHRTETCENEFDFYRYFLVEAVSPFTKIPGTPYRQLGIGLKFEGKYEIAIPETEGGTN